MRTRIIAVLSALLLAAAGCGGESAAEGGGEDLRIAEPASGATVSTPFTVRVEASVPLGTTESGRQHVHVWLDDNADEYHVVESNQVEIAAGTVPPGEHVIHASLRNADHSDAGPTAETTVTVGGGGGAPAASPTAGDTGGYGY